MKRVIATVVMLVMLSGCGKQDALMGQVLKLRTLISQCKECTFQADITADYGDSTYSFSMNCALNEDGTMNLTVTNPETISGISVCIDKATGKFVFDDKMLAFEMIADGHISPVGAPFLLIKALRSGYINTCGKNGDRTVVQIDDSFANTQYVAQIYLNSNFHPDYAEIIWDGKRILSLAINEFVIL